MRNPVAKFLNIFNHPQTHEDRKKSEYTNFTTTYQEHTYIYAGTWEEVKTYARKNFLFQWTAIDTVERLRGCRNLEIMCVGTYKNREDYYEFLHIVKCYGHEMIEDGE
jgi:hypothetical protein